MGDNRKNHKLLDVPIKRKKDTVTESSLVTLEMKESSQQLDTSTIELTKFRSSTNDGIFLSINEELQLDTSFTQDSLEKNVKNTNTKEKGKQLQKQIFQKEKCKEHSTKPTIDRDNLDFCLVCDKPDDLICCDICPSSFHLKCIGMKKQDAVGTSSWHCEICQNNKKKQSEDIMKGDISHDIINKVFVPLKISCRGYRKKISILCKIHELVTFLINDEFGRFFSAQIDTPIYNQIIKDPKDLTTIVMNLINGTYLQDASSTLSRKDINVCNLNENTFDEIILAVLNDIEKVWQNCFVFNEEGSAVYRIGKIMQEKYHTISQRSFYNDLTPDIKLDLVKYIKECSKEQQQILSPDNRKNHKLLDVPIKRKNDTVTESSLVTLEMKESSHQLDTSTIELTKFRSNTNDGSFLSRNEELQLDTSFTQDSLEKNVKNTNTKEKGKQLQKQIFQKEKCKEHSTKPTIDRDNLDFCLVCDKPDDLICCDICPSSF